MPLIESLQPVLPVMWLAVGIAFLALVIAVALLCHTYKDVPGVKQKRLMTENEREFYERLKAALPTCDVLPQVAMSAVMDTVHHESASGYWEERRKFAQKVIDYVVYKDGAVIALIELDDRTHDPAKDAERDRLTAAAGLKTLRFDSRAKPSVEEVRRQVLGLLERSS